LSDSDSGCPVGWFFTLHSWIGNSCWNGAISFETFVESEISCCVPRFLLIPTANLSFMLRGWIRKFWEFGVGSRIFCLRFRNPVGCSTCSCVHCRSSGAMVVLFSIVLSLDSWWIELARRTWKDCGICWSERLWKEHHYSTHSTFLRRQCKLPLSACLSFGCRTVTATCPCRHDMNYHDVAARDHTQYKLWWTELRRGSQPFHALVPLGYPVLSTRTTSSRTTNLIES